MWVGSPDLRSWGPAGLGDISTHALCMGLGERSGTPAGDPTPRAARPGAAAPVTIFPLPGRRVDDAEELVAGDSLGVQVHCDRLPLQVLVGLVERLEDLGKGGVPEDRAAGQHPRGGGPPCEPGT